MVSQWVGHFDPASTLSVYVRPTRDNLADGAAKLAAVYDTEAAS
jgi:hypothetical protein